MKEKEILDLLEKKSNGGETECNESTLEYKYHSSDQNRFKSLDTGWSWMVLLASFGTFWIIGGTVYAVGITQTIFLERFNESVSMTSWAGALHSSLSSLGGPLSSSIVDKYSCRTAIVTSGMLYTLGYLTTAFVPSIHLAILTYGFIGGLGGAFGYVANLVVVGFNFHKRRNFALGIASSGIGVGLLSFAPIMHLSVKHYGTTGFFFIVSGLCLHIVLFGAMCFPSRLELHSHSLRKKDIVQNREESSKWFTCLKHYIHVISNKAILCLAMNKFMFCFGTLTVFVHLPSYIVAEGYSVLQASYVLSIIGVCSIVGRIVTGTVASYEQINVMVLFIFPKAVIAMVTVLFPLYSRYVSGQIVFGLIFGTLFGSGYVLITTVNIKFVGIKYVSAASGFEFLLCGLGSIVGPVLAGFLVDYGGTYHQVFIVAGLCLVLSTVLCLITLCLPSADNDQTKEIQIRIKD